MKRIFICAERFFPRGDAGANRVLYIAKAMKEKTWKPIVISIGDSSEKYYSKESDQYFYEGVEFKNIACKTNGTLQKVERMFLNGVKTVQILKKYKMTSADKILVYSSTTSYAQVIISYAHNIGSPVAIDIVEWHQSFQFKYRAVDIRYLSYKKYFYRLTKKVKNVVVISSFLERYFKGKGCNVLTLPIYIEAKAEYKYKSNDSNLDLIYPGNPYRKDSLENILEGIAMLTSNEQSKIKIHFTGVKRRMLEQSIPGKEILLDMPCVKIHEFMDYQDLMILYESMDFALIARPDNIVTKANFPSKVPELMSRGIPVIINDIGDISNYLNDGEDAILIKMPTSEAVSKAIKACLKMSFSEREEMHRMAFLSAKEKFDYNESSENLDTYFSKI